MKVKECQFKYYVLNYDSNKKSVIRFNIFNNMHVQTSTLSEVVKYLNSPESYSITNRENEELHGFQAFSFKLQSIIMWQEWSRREYEIFVGDAFEEDCSRLEKVDCFYQCELNIDMIAREVIWQYQNA